MNFKKSQISVVEIIFMILLFALISPYLFFDFNISDKDYKLSLESAIDSIYYSEDFRDIILSEDLVSVGRQENWNSVELLLDDMLNSYELEVRDGANFEKIFSCSEKSNKVFIERIISIDSSGNNIDFRIIKLGVCY